MSWSVTSVVTLYFVRVVVVKVVANDVDTQVEELTTVE